MRKVFLVSMMATLPAVVQAQVAAPALARPVAAMPASIPVDRVVAVVGDQVILWSDVINSINQQRANGLELPKDSSGQAALARDALSALVDEEILVQKAHLMKVEVTQDEVNRTVDDQVKRVRGQFTIGFPVARYQPAAHRLFARRKACRFYRGRLAGST